MSVKDIFTVAKHMQNKTKLSPFLDKPLSLQIDF